MAKERAPRSRCRGCFGATWGRCRAWRGETGRAFPEKRPIPGQPSAAPATAVRVYVIWSLHLEDLEGLVLVQGSGSRVLQLEEELGSRGGECQEMAGGQAAVWSWAKAPFDSARGRGGDTALAASLRGGRMCLLGPALSRICSLPPANRFSFDF